jgi:hypothetical protein
MALPPASRPRSPLPLLPFVVLLLLTNNDGAAAASVRTGARISGDADASVLSSAVAGAADDDNMESGDADDTLFAELGSELGSELGKEMLAKLNKNLQRMEFEMAMTGGSSAARSLEAMYLDTLPFCGNWCGPGWCNGHKSSECDRFDGTRCVSSPCTRESPLIGAAGNVALDPKGLPCIDSCCRGSWLARISAGCCKRLLPRLMILI